MGQSTLIFVDTCISLQHSVGYVKRSLCAKTSSIRPYISIEHRLVTDRLRHRQTDTDTGSQLVPALAERRAGNDKKNKGKLLLRGKCKNTNSAQLIHHVSSTSRMALISCDISATSSTMQIYSFSLLPVTDLVNKNYHISACSATAAAAAAPSRRCLHQTSSDDARYYGNHDDHVTE